MSLDQISFLPPEQQQEILNGPALLPPNGTRPNFDNSPNNNGLGIAALTVCLIASSLAMLLRAHTRIFVDKTSRIEDYIGLSAFGTYVGYIYLNYRLLVVCGFFVHQWDVRVKEMSQILYLVTVGSTLYSVTVGLLKLVILREFCGIFVPLGGRNAFWWACHVLMGLNVAYYFATGIFVTNFSCTPREKIWDKTIPGGHCIDNKVTYLAASVVNVISDFIILALPQKIIWNLKMPTRTKIGASAVFAVGLLACVSAVVRLSVTISWYSADDELYALSSMTLWAIAEMTCMFLVFCSHAAPRAFRQKAPTSHMAATAKSWLSLPSSRLRDVPGITKDDHAEYSRIDESRGGLNTTASVGPPQEDVDRSKVAILYTKHFTATEGQARDSIEMDRLNRQHPWTNYRDN